ncbi:MAG: MerR family transcriptional regulator [Desulfobacterales bacterium RIFOXYA12_FULL_46_15]|nr:MAG: MerR family transcriptional regulator [Desulfobacula sp. GWF2_41_7]OGR23262.1 MAG: MerR family transcriptional regulator [Desulfobacterales bacterium RIFOXYA12_FULL_46_15]
MSKEKKTTSDSSISRIADELDISTRTIRFYEEKGLIRPRRTTGNQRVYTPRNKARLKLIIRGKRFGFSLDEIAEMIGMADADPNELEQIEKSLKYGDVKLKELRERKKELTLLEQDILATREKLIKRKTELEITGSSTTKGEENEHC